MKYLSIFIGVQNFIKIWGWDGLKNRFNFEDSFEKVYIVGLSHTNKLRIFQNGNLEIHILPIRRFIFKVPIITTLLLTKYCVKLVKEKNISLVVHFYSSILDEGLPVILTGSICKIPSIVTVQNDYTNLFRNNRKVYMKIYWINKLLEKFVYKKATYIRCVSGWLKNYLYNMGIPLKKIVFVPRCIDLQFFEYSPVESNRVFEEYNLNNDSEMITFLTVAKFTPQKNLKRMLLAFSEVLKNYKNLRILIAGEGELKTEIQNFVRRLGINENVFFVGRIPQRKLKYLYLASDIFILISIFEGRSMAAVEALYAGLPVIVSDIPSMREIIGDVEVGIFVNPYDAEEIRRAILLLATNPDLRIKFSKNAKRHFKKEVAINCLRRKMGFLKKAIFI